MIDRKIIVEAISLLKITYPNSLKDLGEADLKMMIDVWYNDFKDVSKEEFKKAIQDIRYTSKFFPSIADIKEEIARIKTNDIPEAEDEWQEVLNTVRQFGSYREQEALQDLKPYTSKIVRYIGYQRICASTPDEQTWNKKEFIGEYNALKDKVRNDLQLGMNEIKMIENN